MEEMQARMKAAFDANDPEGMMRAWMPLGMGGTDAFQKFQKAMWDSATGHAEEGRQIACRLMNPTHFRPGQRSRAGPGWRWCGCRGPLAGGGVQALAGSPAPAPPGRVAAADP